MMKIFTSAALFTLIIISAYPQNDPKATSILDKFSAQATSAPSVYIDFLFISHDQTRNSTDSVAGSVSLNKNSYRLDLPDNIIWYNGTTSWSYLPAEKEVTITKPDSKENSFQSRPSMIFTMYRDGYKCRLLEEKSDSYLIDLYPSNPENEIIRVRLLISKPSLSLKKFEYKMKNGITWLLLVKDYNLKKTPEPGFYEFNASKYKGTEIVDMR